MYLNSTEHQYRKYRQLQPNDHLPCYPCENSFVLAATEITRYMYHTVQASTEGLITVPRCKTTYSITLGDTLVLYPKYITKPDQRVASSYL